MGTSFTNFLNDVGFGLTHNPADMKDYQHADRLYVRNTYARAPKVSFLYFVELKINRNAVLNQAWAQRDMKDVGLLVKKVDLPKFSITPETLNQYNRKTVIQTKLNYSPVNIEFHDDNSDITTNLWKNYYQYYYVDGVYSEATPVAREKIVQYGDTKYGTANYAYGFDNFPKLPFFESIEIYVLHQRQFTQITLVNPLITEWAHDSLNQDENSKTLANKMTVMYESVGYRQGKIVKGQNPPRFGEVYYDTQPSPLTIGGGIPGTIFGSSGIIAGAESIFGANGSLANAKSPLDFLGVALQSQNIYKGIGQINSTRLQSEGYSIGTSLLGGVSATGNQPGGVVPAAVGGLTQNGFGIVAKIGVNLFSNRNSSTNGTTKTTPSNLTGG